MLDRLKIQADQDAQTRKDAFTYAQELRNAWTPETAAWHQENGLTDQFNREGNGAMDVVAGRVHPNQWHPQYSFEAAPGGGAAPSPPGTAPQLGMTGAPVPPAPLPAPGPTQAGLP